MSFSVSDGRGGFEYNGSSRERPVREPREPRAPVVPPDDPRPAALQPRGAGADRAQRQRPVPGRVPRRGRLLARVRRAADRARRPPPCGRPTRRRCGSSRRASSPSSSTTTACSASPAGRSGARWRAARAATSRRLTRRRSPTRLRLSRAGAADRALRRLRRGHAGRRRAASASTRWCWPRTPTRRWRCSPTRATPSARCWARSPTSRTRPSCTPTARCCPRRRRAWASWNFHLQDEPVGRTTVTYHMNRLQSLDADREFCVTLNRSDAIDPAKVIRTHRYAHPVYTPGGAGRAGALGRGERRATAPTTAAPTGARASTRTAWSPRCGCASASERRCV